MFSKRVKREVIIVLSGAILLTGAAIRSNRQEMKKEEPVAQAAEPDYRTTAGVTVAFDESHAYDSNATAGISVAFSDINRTQVVAVDTELVALGQTPEPATSPADTEPEVQEAEVVSIAGYTNLGIATLSEGANLNVRDAASIDGGIIGKMTNHNACEILGTEGEWSRITSGDLEGYVKSEFLVTGEEAFAIAQQEIAPYAAVQVDNLRVRKEPSTEASVLGKVNQGTSLKVLSVLDGWIQVEFAENTGYISADYAEISDRLPEGKTMEQLRSSSDSGVSSVRQDLVNYACQFIGNRYVWGGTSLTNGVDCSGFTMKIYARYGVYLPHSSRAQPSYGTRISASEAKPGDLFFYGSGRYISHVAIYIGDGQIVHASNAKSGIKISSAYYQSPICVVRYLDD